MIKYYIVIGIIYMIPYMVMIGISCLKDKLETDRNFYGKDINPKEIKLINVSYEKLKIERKKFEKCTEMGQIKYIYTQNFGYEQLILSEEEYNKYFPDMFVDTAIAYFIIYKFAYDSPKGMLEAETKLIKPTMEKKYEEDDVKEVKGLIYELCKNKLFADLYRSESYYNGRTITHRVYINTKKREGTITGKSKIKPGRYDWMFSNSSWYPLETKKKKRNKFLAFFAYLNPNKTDTIFHAYIALGIYGIYFIAWYKLSKIMSNGYYTLLHIVLSLFMLGNFINVIYEKNDYEYYKNTKKEISKIHKLCIKVGNIMQMICVILFLYSIWCIGH